MNSCSQGGYLKFDQDSTWKIGNKNYADMLSALLWKQFTDIVLSPAFKQFFCLISLRKRFIAIQ